VAGASRSLFACGWVAMPDTNKYLMPGCFATLTKPKDSRL
jgi:hypothetical protein